MQPAIAVRQLTKNYEEGASGYAGSARRRSRCARGRTADADGAFGQRQDYAAFDHGMHSDGDLGKCARCRKGSGGTAARKQLPAIRLEHIGFVFQGFNLFPTLTAGENVELMLDLKGDRATKGRKSARRSCSSKSDWANKYGAFPADLSGGQKQRDRDCARAGRGSRNHARRRANGRARLAYRSQRDGDDERAGAQARTRGRDCDARFARAEFRRSHRDD